MHKKIKFFKNELLNMMKLTQFIKKFNGSFGPPYTTLSVPKQPISIKNFVHCGVLQSR